MGPWKVAPKRQQQQVGVAQGLEGMLRGLDLACRGIQL